MAHTASALADVAAAKSQIDAVFSGCDTDGNGHLAFPEAASLFKHLAPEKSTLSACNAAIEALLMVDKNSDAQLDRAEFEQLLIQVSTISDVPLLEAANKLLAAIQQHPATAADYNQVQAAAAAGAVSAGTSLDAESQPNTVPDMESTATPKSSRTLLAAAPVAVAAAPSGAETTAADACSTSVEQSMKLLALFDYWDTNRDGHVGFSELCQGLAKFKRVSCKKDVASLLRESSSVLAVHDTNSDGQLDFDEFRAFITAFVSAAGYQLADVLDEVILIVATKPDNTKLQQVLDCAQPQITEALLSRQ